MSEKMAVPLRKLSERQTCQVWVHDIVTGCNTLLFESGDILLEAPNWSLTQESLILNGDGVLWTLAIGARQLSPIKIDGVPSLNNDHVPAPDGAHIFLSANDDWHIYRAPIGGGPAARVTGKSGPEGLMHFLHGVSPDGTQLAFVGLRLEPGSTGFTVKSAEICTVGADGENFRQITHSGTPADGPEYSPDGAWIYFNTEAFSGHAQIARMRPDGSQMERLGHTATVDWFPHIAPDGRSIVYLAYPEGTRGHPADLPVKLMLVRDGDFARATAVADLFGGQGTINVNSWSPDSRRFAYVAYPVVNG